MEFEAAAIVAKRHPGATVVRDNDGLFAVVLASGEKVRVEDSVKNNEEKDEESIDQQKMRELFKQLNKKIEDLEKELKQSYISIERTNEKICQNKNLVLHYINELDASNKKLREAESELITKCKEIIKLKSRIDELNDKFSKVSPEEWERIRGEEEKILAEKICRQEANKKKAFLSHYDKKIEEAAKGDNEPQAYGGLYSTTDGQ